MTHIKGNRQKREWPCQKCGWCCIDDFYMDTELVNKYRHRFQRPVTNEKKPPEHLGKETYVFTKLLTLENLTPGDCVFLKLDNTCAIYEDRPQTCKKFGLLSGKLECPNVAPNGRIRTKEEAKRTKIRLIKKFNKMDEDKFKERGMNLTISFNEDNLT